MFLARCDTKSGLVLGVGLSQDDLRGICQQGRPRSFALADAQVTGPSSQDRVMIAYARPEQIEQLRNGYQLGITDARVAIYLCHEALQQIRAGRSLDITDTGHKVATRFVVFQGTTRQDAERGMRHAGLRVRANEPIAPSLLLQPSEGTMARATA